jgi:hypothetical protein
MKNFSRSASMVACAAVACLAGASVALADDGGRILSYSDLVKLAQPTETQLEAARAATLKYRDVNVAVAEGFFPATPDIPGEGFHYLLPSRISCSFDPASPAVLLYAFPPGQTRLKLVALEYLIPFACMPADGPAPEGFAGSLDSWSNDEPVPFWTMNAWLYFRNPDGMLTGMNPLIQ